MDSPPVWPPAATPPGTPQNDLGFPEGPERRHERHRRIARASKAPGLSDKVSAVVGRLGVELDMQSLMHLLAGIQVVTARR